MSDRMRRYYQDNPNMVSSPFGGVTGINRALLDEVTAQLGISWRGKRALDVGCGRGFLGEIVREAGGDYIGADLVASRSGVRMALCDAQRLPFEDAAFDVVCCFDAFEHIPNPARAVQEFRRVLRKGGVVFLSAPNYGNMAGLVKLWCEKTGRYAPNTWAPFGRWIPQELEHLLTLRSVRRLFKATGARHIEGIGYGAEVELGLFPWIAHPRFPEFLLYRLQRVMRFIGPGLVRVFPGASLHVFWKISFD